MVGFLPSHIVEILRLGRSLKCPGNFGGLFARYIFAVIWVVFAGDFAGHFMP